MPKPEESRRSREQNREDDGVSAPQDAAYDVVGTGTMDGKIRDVEVDLITGDVTQTNVAGQAAANAAADDGGGSQAIGQGASQTNEVLAQGAADLDIVVDGTFRGKIRDVEVGLITGDVTQTNISGQAAANVSVDGDGGGSQAVGQSVGQDNFVMAIGEVEVDLVFSGTFTGKIRDLEVGLITGDIAQTNVAGQAAGNVSSGGDGSQAIGQSATQANYVAAVGDIDITLVFEGDFRGKVSDVTIGLITADTSQTNTAIQVGMNVSARHDGGRQDVEQFITQTNSVGEDGDLDVVITFDPHYRGDYRGIEIGLTVDNVLQSNAAAVLAANVAEDQAWA